MKNLILLLFLLFSLSNVFSQEESKTVADTLEKEEVAIPIGEITSRTEELSSRFIDLREQIKPSAQISSVDTLLDASFIKLNQEKDLVYSDSSDQSYRSIQFVLKKWQGYENQLNDIQENLKNRSEEIKEVSDEASNYLVVWQETKDKAVENKASKEVIESTDQVIETINTIILNTNLRSDSLFLIQKRLTEQALLIDDVINEILIRQKNLQSNYFIIDSPEIWKAQDSLSTFNAVNALLRKGISHDATTLWDYLLLNRASFFSQILFLIVFLIMLIYLNHKWIKKTEKQIANLDKIKFQVLSNPIASTIVAGFLVSIFFYRNNPPVLGELMVMIIMAATVYLLPKLTAKRLLLLLALLFVLLLINLEGNMMGIKALPTRISSLVSSVVMFYILLDFRFNKSFKSYFNKKWSKLASAAIYLFLILIVIGFIANLIGSVNLSDFIFSGVMFSSVFAAITWVATKVFGSIILLLVKEDPNKEIQTLSSFKLLIQKRIEGLLNWGGFIFWIYLTLIAFSVIKYVNDLLTDLMDLKWEVGELTISLGGIISFLVILFFTVLITKIISGIFKEDWIENTSLPKGSSSAISIVLRIIVTTLGLYLAASAAGIDLSQFGFILGALSVGIGFGLQSVVLNFIAGLILAFERPINVGDKIEVDLEFGTVSEIGIRATKVNTWSGTEVIIPNGDLVSKKVINFTLSNEKRRFKVPFRTTLDADPKQVMEILTTIAKNHPNTLEDPAPKTYFWGYGDASLDFFLYFWTEFSLGLSTRGAIMLEIHDKLKAAGIKIAIPIRKMQIEKEDEDDITPQSS